MCLFPLTFHTWRICLGHLPFGGCVRCWMRHAPLPCVLSPLTLVMCHAKGLPLVIGVLSPLWLYKLLILKSFGLEFVKRNSWSTIVTCAIILLKKSLENEGGLAYVWMCSIDCLLRYILH